MNGGVIVASLFLLLIMMRVDPKRVGYILFMGLAALGVYFILSNYQIVILPR